MENAAKSQMNAFASDRMNWRFQETQTPEVGHKLKKYLLFGS
jgi:hypothetical protein